MYFSALDSFWPSELAIILLRREKHSVEGGFGLRIKTIFLLTLKFGKLPRPFGRHRRRKCALAAAESSRRFPQTPSLSASARASGEWWKNPLLNGRKLRLLT
jgi:hypothetical protein